MVGEVRSISKRKRRKERISMVPRDVEEDRGVRGGLFLKSHMGGRGTIIT